MACFILCVGVDGKGSDGGLSCITRYDLWDIQKRDGLSEEEVCTFITQWFRIAKRVILVLGKGL